MTQPNPQELTDAVRQAARAEKFTAMGAAPAVIGLQFDRLRAWLDAGKQGEMTYMAQQAEARRDPNLLLDGVRAIFMVALPYHTQNPVPRKLGTARISRYAWGADYHEVLRGRLNAVRQRLADIFPALRTRAVVDSAPLMERDFAQLAGLGWIGKNTLLLNRALGSWFFLGGLLLDAELAYDVAFHSNHCGTCTRCLDACPTQAFTGPYQLDPRRCISYLTIEHRSEIPQELAELMGDWIFGCDVCQDVCPWNHKVPPASGATAFSPRNEANPVDLALLLDLNDQQFRARFRGTPLFRAKRARVLRNAAIAAANQQRVELIPRLTRLAEDADPVLRAAARSALERLANEPAKVIPNS